MAPVGSLVLIFRDPMTCLDPEGWAHIHRAWGCMARTPSFDLHWYEVQFTEGATSVRREYRDPPPEHVRCAIAAEGDK